MTFTILRLHRRRKKSGTAALYLEFSANRLSGGSELQVQDLKEHLYVFGKSVSELKQAISSHFQ